MSSNYYYLVANLPKIAIDLEQKDAINIPLLKEEVRLNVPESAYAHVDMLFARYDISNLLNLILKRNQPFSDKGRFTQEQLEEALVNPKQLPSYMADLVKAFVPKPVSEDEAEQQEPETEVEGETAKQNPADKDPEMFVLSRFYNKALSSRNAFIRKWFTFDRDVSNILAAITARRLGIDRTGILIGKGKVVDALESSTAEDFGLGLELEYMDALLKATEQTDMMERERRIDTLRFEMADELTQNNHFDIDFILAFLQKADIADRWLKFDKATGMAMFKQILKDIQSEFDIQQALSEDIVLKKLAREE